MELVNLFVSIIGGIIGGNIAGTALPEDKNLGVIGNSIAGLFGGAIGGSILQAFGIITFFSTQVTQTPSNSLDIGIILANIGTSAASGAILMTIIGFIKSAMNLNSEG